MAKAERKSPEQLRQEWAERTITRLQGRKIVSARWMTTAEVEAHLWSHSAVVLELDDGTLLIPQADDEGNDAGVLRHLTNNDEFLMPVI